MELKSVTVQMKVRGRDETHELTWDPKVKAYVSASGTVKVKDPKAKKVEVLVRKTVLDKWDTFKGKCGVGGSNEEICKIDDKKRHQQITVRFAPTAKAAEANRGFFTDYTYTDDEVKEGIKEWVTDKIAQGELKGPPASHLKALESQLKGHKLTKDELWIRLEGYTQSQRDSVRNRKPLFKWVPRTPIQIVITPPKTVKSNKLIATAKAAITQLDRSIKTLKANKKSYQDLNHAGEKVWFAMQPLLKSTDPNAAAMVTQLKEARARYNRACQVAIPLVQKKVDQMMARLDTFGQRLEKAAEKGPARAFQEARRAFKSQCNATRKAIIAASQILILPDEKTSVGAGLILKRMTDLDVLEKAGLSLTYSEKPAAPPPVREKAPPPPPTPPAVKDAQRALQRLTQHAAFLPKSPADGSLYDKSMMDSMHRKGKLSRLYVLAAELAKAKVLVASLDQRDPGVALLRRALDSVVTKVNAAQAYLIREKIDINSVTIFNYRAQPPLRGLDRESDYDWLKDRAKRHKALALADGVVKGLKALMGDSSKRLAKDIPWKADTLFGVTGKEGKVDDFKKAWEQAFAIKAAFYNYEMYKRIPYRAPVEVAKPTGLARKEATAPTTPVTTQKAFAAVDRAYNRLYTAGRLADQERKFIYEEEVASIGKLLEDAKKQMDALPDSSDDSSGNVLEYWAKLTKAQGLFDVLKIKPVKRGAVAKQASAPAGVASVSVAQRAAHMQYSPIRNALRNAIAEANATYNRFFDDAGNPKLQTLSAAQIAQYRDQLQRLDRKLDAGLSDDMRSRLPKEDQAEWDGLQPEKSIAQGKVADVTAQINVIEEAARAATPAPAAKAPPPSVSERDQTPTELAEEVQRLRGLATAAGTLSDAVAHRDALTRIMLEAQRRGLKVLEGSAFRSLKVANARVVELGGTASEPKPSAPPSPVAPSAAELSAKQRADAEAAKAKREAEAREAAETKAKYDAATQDTTRLKDRYDKIAQGLKDAKLIADVDTFETEIKMAIASLSDHAKVIGAYAEGVRNRFDTLLKRVPALRAELEATERYAAVQSEVSALGAKANGVMQQGEAILGKPVVDPADTPKLQVLVKDLDDIEASLKRIFDGLSKEQDSLKNRITGILGRIHEVSGKMSDRIQLQTSLAQKDKAAVVDTLGAEAGGLIKKSAALRKKGAKAIDQLKPILARLAAIEKTLDEIDKTLKEGDPLKERNFALWANVLQEIGSIEKITRPLKSAVKPSAKPAPEAVPPEAPLPGEPTPTAPKGADVPAPAKAPEPAAPPSPTSKPGVTEKWIAKIDEHRKLVNEYNDDYLRDDKKYSPDTKLAQLMSVRQEIQTILRDKVMPEREAELRTLDTDALVQTVLALKLKATDVYRNKTIQTAKKIDMLNEVAKQLRSCKAELSKFPDKSLDVEAANRGVEDIESNLRLLQTEIGDQTPTGLATKLTSQLGITVTAVPDGSGLVIHNVDMQKYSQIQGTLFNILAKHPNPIKAAIIQLPERDTLGLSTPLTGALGIQNRIPVRTMFDPAMPGSSANLLLFFEKSGADTHYKKMTADVTQRKERVKQEVAIAETGRLVPLNDMDKVARAKGGRAIEATVQFTEEGKKNPSTNRFFASRVNISSADAALQYVKQVRDTMKLEPNEMLMILVGEHAVAKELQSSLTEGTHDRAVFEVKGIPAGTMVVITRSAYANDSYLGQPPPLAPLSPSGQRYNVAVGDWAKTKPAYSVFQPVLKKLGLNAQRIDRLFPQAKRQTPALPATLARPVDERQMPASVPSPAPAVPAAGPIKLPKVYNTVQVSEKFLPKQFGLKPDQAAIYQSTVSTGDLDNPGALTQRIANIRGHAVALGMDHVLVIYRGVTRAGRDHYNQFAELVKKSDPELKFIHTTRIEQGSLADGEDDVVHFVLLRDASVPDEQIAAKLKTYLKKQMDESH